MEMQVDCDSGPGLEEELEKAEITSFSERYEAREYQSFLFQKAKEQNLIICLPTGCGKTFVAVQLIKYYLPEAIEKRRKIFFLAPTVPLVHQQGNYLQNHIPSSYENSHSHVKIITGDMVPDGWDGTQWSNVLDNHEIFTLTPQILVDAIERAVVTWEEISLLVLDECHHATKEHPYASLMRNYSEKLIKENGVIGLTLPRILGLSASIISGSTSASVEDSVRKIQKDFHCQAITFPDYEKVLICATSAEVLPVKYQTNALHSSEKMIMSDLESLMDDLETQRYFVEKQNQTIPKHHTLNDDHQVFNSRGGFSMEDIISQIGEIVDAMEHLGAYCCLLAAVTVSAFIQKQLFTEKRCRDSDKTLCSVMTNVLTRIDLFVVHLEDLMRSYCEVEEDEKVYCWNYVSPKLQSVRHILYRLGPQEAAVDSPPLCALVFCKTRFFTKIITYYLQDLSSYHPEKFGFLKSSFVLGAANGASNRNMMLMKASLAKQAEVLREFRSKDLNLLVCTNVLEEGLDVPSCNVIMRLDSIDTYPSYVQSMGRARQKGSKFYVLMNNDLVDEEMKKINDFRSFNVALSDALQKAALHPEKYFNGKEDEIENPSVSKCLNDLIPPFRPTAGPQQISANSAITVAYRYCHTLSKGIFSTLAPFAWWNKFGMDDEATYQVRILFPPNSVIKEVVGPIFSSKYLAKKAAFLEACKQLYAKGVLNESTLLPNAHVRALPSYICKILNDVEKGDHLPINGKKVGSKNRFVWYKKQVPEALSVRDSEDASISYRIYAIEIQLEAYFSVDELKKLFEFSERPFVFAILTKADLSKVPAFLLQSREGNFKTRLNEVHLRMNQQKEVLSQLQKSLLKNFQNAVFKGLLKMDHVVLKDLPESSDLYFIAPIRNNNNLELQHPVIDWDLVSKVIEKKEIDYNIRMTDAERRQLTFCQEDYIDALLIPWYDPGHHDKQVFAVLGIEKSQDADSSFDDPTISPTYTDYFSDRHNIQLFHKKQPLIKAKVISKQLNFLSMKYDESWKITKEGRQEEKMLRSIRTIVPETVRIHPLPATLFIQAKFLPSCLHRIFRLLIANEMRESISNYCGISNRKWELELAINDLRLRETNDHIKNQAANKFTVFETSKPVVELGVELHSDETKPLSISEDPYKIHKPTKRRLYWCEIEYIHPRDLTIEVLFGPIDQSSSSKWEEIDMKFLVDCPAPSKAEKCQISLIQPNEVPEQKFDFATSFGEGSGPLAHTIMEALTIATAQDCMTLEKLEVIGDSVLKLLVSLHVFGHFPSFDEGNMTELRMRLICNKYLFNLGDKKQLGSVLAGGIFQPDSCWLPIGQYVPEDVAAAVIINDTTYAVFESVPGADGYIGELNTATAGEILNWVEKEVKSRDFSKYKAPTTTTYTHSKLGDKSIADSVEALIGAYYLDSGLDGAVQFMDWIGIRAPTAFDQSQMQPLTALRNLPKVELSQPIEEKAASYLPYLTDIEDLLQYRFKNKWLLVEAFTHSTYVYNQRTPSYEKLEFLGDAVLDFLVTHYIYKIRKYSKPGQLTDLRSALVNNITFGSLAVRYNLHQHLLHFSSELQDSIDAFSNYQQKGGHKVVGHFTFANDDDSHTAVDVEVPKVLGDIFESVAGAVLVDSDFSLDTVWKVFYRLMKKEFDEFSENIPKEPVRELHERFPGRIKFTKMENAMVEEAGLKSVKLEIPGYQIFNGCGSNYKNAKKAASKCALRVIKLSETMGTKTKIIPARYCIP